MPPYAFWLQGPSSIQAWLLGPGAPCRGSRLLRTEACGGPAFAQYRLQPDGSFAAWGLILLEREGGRIAAWNTFLDAETLFPLFGLPTMEFFAALGFAFNPSSPTTTRPA